MKAKTVYPLTGMGKMELTRKKDNGTIAIESANAHITLSEVESWFFAFISFLVELKNTYDQTNPGTNITSAVPSIMNAKSNGFTF